MLTFNHSTTKECTLAGKIKATTHQVVNPGGPYAKAERFAAVFFGSWSSDYSLKPFDSCKDEMTSGMSSEEKQEYLSKYPGVSVKDALTSRLIEMGTIKNPEEHLVRDLHGKGLLRKPTMELQGKYSHIFG